MKPPTKITMANGVVGYADLIANPTTWHQWRRNVPEMIAALDLCFSAA
jgi:hypothetical protein